ncbi:MAG: ArsA family ATPase [Proteobacteria bacterium]|nr:ArsA family ATPase [Pseudomonadota bacterium]
MLPSFLNNRNLKLTIFGGKGGTGKTTSASAAALSLAWLYPSKKVLLISSDPAHSVGDSLGLAIGANKMRVDGVPNLEAQEIDPAPLLEVFKKNHEKEIKEIIQRAGFYGQINIKEFLSFSLPGMEEMMIFLHIADKYKHTWYQPQEADIVVLDTAPTGHTLRLLDMPGMMDEWMDVVDQALLKYKVHPRLYASGSEYHEGDRVDQMVEKMRQDFKAAKELLTNREQTEFVPVLIPEAMAIEETEDLLKALKERQIQVNSILINRVRGSNGTCPFCASKAEDQSDSIKKIENTFGEFNLIKVPLFPYEVQGIRSLEKYADILMDEVQSVEVEANANEAGASQVQPSNHLRVDPEVRFVMFGGKGGVGKTSMAAAMAVHLARKYSDQKVLIYSVDPAHSLADSFGVEIGDKLTPIQWSASGSVYDSERGAYAPEGGQGSVTSDEKNSAFRNPQSAIEGNLFAMEIDSEHLLHDFIEDYRSIIRDAFDTWEGMREAITELRYDRNVMAMFARTAPPGMNEVLGLENLTGFITEKKFDWYILDTAPTGHLLVLLEFPNLVRDWLSRAYRSLVKYQVQIALTNLKELGTRILKSTQLVNKIHEMLTNPQVSQLVTVTIPEAMAVEETGRLLASVKRLGVPCGNIFINMITPPSHCNFCSSKRESEQTYIQKLSRMNSEYNVVQVPLFPHQITGLEELTKLSEMVYG